MTVRYPIFSSKTDSCYALDKPSPKEPDILELLLEGERSTDPTVLTIYHPEDKMTIRYPKYFPETAKSYELDERARNNPSDIVAELYEGFLSTDPTVHPRRRKDSPYRGGMFRNNKPELK